MIENVIEAINLQTQYFQVDGCNIRYSDTGGDGPVLVCCTGVGGSLELWSYQLLLSQRNVRVITWDYPCHGLSTGEYSITSLNDIADIALKLVNHLEVEDFTLIGNSMGAAVSLRIAHKAKQRVNSLLLLNAATLSNTTPFPFKLMCLPFLGALMTAPGEVAYSQQVDTIFDNSVAVNQAILSVIKRNTYSREAQRGFLQGVRTINTFFGQRTALVKESNALIKNANCPIYLIHGKNDKVIPCQTSVDVHERFNNTKLSIIENCGHTPQVEYPDVVNTLVLVAIYGENNTSI